MPNATSATIAVMVTIGRLIAKSEMNISALASSSSTRTRLPGVTPCAEPSSTVSPSATPDWISTSSAASSRTPSWTALSATRPPLMRCTVGVVPRLSIAASGTRDGPLGVGGDPSLGEEARHQPLARCWGW